MTDEISVHFDLSSLNDYRTFLRVKDLPRCRIIGRTAYMPKEYLGWIASMAKGHRVIVAWGGHRKGQTRVAAVLQKLAELGCAPECFGVTKDGHPRHPLYLPTASTLPPFVCGAKGMVSV